MATMTLDEATATLRGVLDNNLISDEFITEHQNAHDPSIDPVNTLVGITKIDDALQQLSHGIDQNRTMWVDFRRQALVVLEHVVGRMAVLVPLINNLHPCRPMEGPGIVRIPAVVTDNAAYNNLVTAIRTWFITLNHQITTLTSHLDASTGTDHQENGEVLQNLQEITTGLQALEEAVNAASRSTECGSPAVQLNGDGTATMTRYPAVGDVEARVIPGAEMNVTGRIISDVEAEHADHADPSSLSSSVPGVDEPPEAGDGNVWVQISPAAAGGDSGAADTPTPGSIWQVPTGSLSIGGHGERAAATASAPVPASAPASGSGTGSGTGARATAAAPPRPSSSHRVGFGSSTPTGRGGGRRRKRRTKRGGYTYSRSPRRTTRRTSPRKAKRSSPTRSKGRRHAKEHKRGRGRSGSHSRSPSRRRTHKK
jgi:hypothetical protein